MHMWVMENKESILAVISIVAFILTVAQLVVGLYKKRTKLDIKIENTQQYESENNKDVIFLVSILNKSNAPINITRIVLIDKKRNEYLCNLRRVWIGEHYYPQFPETDIPRTERVFTTDFPISVSANGARMEYIRFEVGSLINEITDERKVNLKAVTDKKTCTFKLTYPNVNNTLRI